MGTAAPNNIVDGVTFSMVGVKQPDYRHVLVSGKTPEGRKMLEEILRLRTLRIQAYRAQLPEAAEELRLANSTEAALAKQSAV